ncbi:glutamate--tRNA ligase [Rickettsia endosymbiont of Halotydeus destructor]|uniref:glutamate--tRNA ligase n=1 Tax=Rickettsia endosymbiont of Halotydeus destructor TaxID=2996754 RepID=UPI003BAF6D93
MNKNIVTRFAPSPTGFLHIGSARTALFNYLFARHHGGKFFLRIEDTDRERSTTEAVDAILSGLKWLGLNWDVEVIFQSKRNELYKEAALKLLKEGKAYYCFTSQEEIEQQRKIAIESKQHFIFNSPWRDSDPATHPIDRKPVIRLKTSREGSTIIHDTLQGDVVIENSHIDDMVLLRADGNATYMLAVVVDDHDMDITHIIRGDDHLTNAARQIAIYEAFNWQIPSMTHIPLIHGADGAKLSKRHGALGVEAYKEMGYLPNALCNYLLRLGWGHGDDEIINLKQAIEWFDLNGLGKSPAKLDFVKMNNINAHYLRELDTDSLISMVNEILQKDYIVSEQEINYLKQALPSLTIRSETLIELAHLAKIYLINSPINYSEEAQEIIKKCNPDLIKQVITELEEIEDFNKDTLQNKFKEIAKSQNLKLNELMQPVRALMTGMTASPGIFEMAEILGKENSLARLRGFKAFF